MQTLIPPPRPRPASTPWFALLGQYFPILLILGALAWATITIALRRSSEDPPNLRTIHIAHYQLEEGVREGFTKMAAEYTKLHPDVRIVQDWVPISGYGQWLSTQLISGKPSDITEFGSQLPPPVLLSYNSRYFVPLSDYVRQPNPYNAGTDLENTPWLETYFDNMKLSRVSELQQYMSVPLSQFGVRVLVNKTLLKKLTGLDTLPANYTDFIAACDKIKAQSDDRGRTYIPIVGSGNHFPQWVANVAVPLTFPLVQTVDFNHDGYFDTREIFAAITSGLLSFRAHPLEVKFQVTRQLADECQPGFTGINRDEAVFLFIQQRAVFLSSGSWEALSLIGQAKGAFEVGVADFPHPKNTDPGFEGLAPMPPIEVPNASFLFNVTQASKHPDVAIDFLRFLSSKRINEEFNHIIGWIPCINGTRPSPALAAFAPHLKGILGIADSQWALGGDTMVRWTQLQGLFSVDQLSFDDLIAQYAPYYASHGMQDFQESLRDGRRALPATWRGRANQRQTALNAATPHDAWFHWLDYADAMADSLFQAVYTARDEQFVMHGFPAGQTPPGQYSPEAIEAIRSHLQEPPRAGLTPPPAAAPTP